MSLIFPLIRLFGLLLFGSGRSQQRCFVKVTSKKSSLIYAEPSVASTGPTVVEGWTWFVTVSKCCLSTEGPKVFNPPHHYTSTSRSYWYKDPSFHIVYIKSSAHREPADRAASFLSSPIWYRVSCCWLTGSVAASGFSVVCVHRCSSIFVGWFLPISLIVVWSAASEILILACRAIKSPLFPILCLVWTSAGDGELELTPKCWSRWIFKPLVVWLYGQQLFRCSVAVSAPAHAERVLAPRVAALWQTSTLDAFEFEWGRHTVILNGTNDCFVILLIKPAEFTGCKVIQQL